MLLIAEFIGKYRLTLGISAIALVIAILLFLFVRRRPEARLHRILALASLSISLLLLLSLAADLVRAERFRVREGQDFASRSNLLVGALFVGKPLTETISTALPVSDTWVFTSVSDTLRISPQAAFVSNLVPVRPYQKCRYSFYADTRNFEPTGYIQVRILWLDRAQDVLSWNDSPMWRIDTDLFGEIDPQFQTGDYFSPPGATYLQFELRNTNPRYELLTSSNVNLWVNAPKLSCGDVYIETHPDGTQGSIAFSFDWESAMGGAIHSKGMKAHDPSAAATHGLEMRQGADWLNKLFSDSKIKATFYGTGYNLLDGNIQRQTFSADPVYKWAGPKNRWETDYWLTHRWYSDDPFGTYQTHPAWYFGDQTRRLLGAGHEIAPHTFGHLYVRGSNPQELATDMDEWLVAARPLGVTNTTTFAFPWRSSNSLTADFYDVLYKRGIRAVTRIYERDMKDLYTLGAPSVYPDIAVMPDFLLGSPSIAAGEEAGKEIGLQEGLQVITDTVARRGTTSFWTHPEQLADSPEFDAVRAAWKGVVTEGARERDNGKLWIATVADITTYQRDLLSVTTSLDHGFLGLGGWKVQVSNESGKELHGVTLTLPGDVKRISSSTEVLTVQHPSNDTTHLSEPGNPLYPARQIVLPNLPPGTTAIEVEWVPGQEPVE
jgi:peptidoglycan/xylan/chitin deacetylase (PgdA/CDA1 family)